MNAQKKRSIQRAPLALAGALSVLMLVLAACAPAATPAPTAIPTAAPSPTSAPSPTAAPSATSVAQVPVTGEEAEIAVVKDANLGNILVGNNGMTLYMYTKDEADTSNCSAGCLAQWPPLITLGSPKLDDGVDASLVGSTKLADGRMIVTYNHMPLYYWVNDKKPGDTTGQGVGGVWYVVSPDGKPVGMETSSAAATPAAAEAQISVANDAKLGKILVGNNGMTLYMFTNDKPDVSNCNAGCLAQWPPLITQGKPVLGDGVDDSLVGTTKLADGRMIVTYNHMPLYYWVNDKKPGDTTGQGVGGVWYVVSPDGKAVGMASGYGY